MKLTIELEERDVGYLKDDIEAHIQDCSEGISELEEKWAKSAHKCDDVCMAALCKTNLRFWKRILGALNIGSEKAEEK